MAFSRRRFFRYAALTGGCGAAGNAAEAATGLDLLRDVSAAHGANLSDDRLRVIGPVVEQRLSELRALRDFAVDDRIAPTPGILDK